MALKDSRKKPASKSSASKASVAKPKHAEQQQRSTLRFKGCTHFRQRVVCSVLSGKQIRIDEIRPSPLASAGLGDDIQVGLVEFEASFLRLIDKLTNGTKVRTPLQCNNPQNSTQNTHNLFCSIRTDR
jgi:RNA 3'-terminal phosphate cyclase